MKKSLSLLLLAAILLAQIAGCAPKTDGQQAGAGSEEYLIKLGTHLNVGSVGDITSNDFAEIISDLTNGQVTVDVYPGGQLGQEFEAAESVTIGSLDMTYVSTTAYNDVVDGYAVDSLPFLFNSNEEFSYIFNESPVGEKLEQNLIDKGARILCWIPLGFRQMYFTKKEVTSINDIAGMKMRAPESILYLGMLRAIDVNPVTVTWGETYTALQTGVADGCECPYTSITDANMQEVVKYCLVTNHMILCQALIINEALFQSFPEDIRKAILEAGAKAGENAIGRAAEADLAARKTMEDAGVVFHELPAGESEILEQKMSGVRDEWIGDSEARKEIVQMVMDAKAAFAAK